MNPLDNIRVVLVNTLYAGNAGSVCRAMKNMGLSRLVVVSPRQEWNEADVRQMAVSAADVWEARTVCATAAEAVADCVAVAATTARIGLYREHCKTARGWSPELLRLAAQGPVAILFGSEDRGLLNEDVALATHLINIPTSEAYTSLNLAQAVMVVAYELFQAAGIAEPVVERSELASIRFREIMLEKWDVMLREIGFMNEDKAEHMMFGLRRILSRDNLTVNDVKILMGVAQQALWAAHEGPVRNGRRVSEASSAT